MFDSFDQELAPKQEEVKPVEQPMFSSFDEDLKPKPQEVAPESSRPAFFSFDADIAKAAQPRQPSPAMQSFHAKYVPIVKSSFDMMGKATGMANTALRTSAQGEVDREQAAQAELAKEPYSSASGAFLRAAGESVAPTAVGVSAARLAGRGLIRMGVRNPWVATGLGLGAMIAGSMGGKKLQDEIVTAIIGRENKEGWDKQIAADISKHPIATLAGQTAPMLTLQGMSFHNVLKAVTTAKNLITKGVQAATQAEKDNLTNVVVGGGLQGGMEAYNEIQQSKDPQHKTDWTRLAAATVLGLALNKTTKLGKMVFGENAEGKTLKDMTPTEAKAHIEAISGRKLMPSELDEIQTQIRDISKEADDYVAAKGEPTKIALPEQPISPAPEKAGQAPSDMEATAPSAQPEKAAEVKTEQPIQKDGATIYPAEPVSEPSPIVEPQGKPMEPTTAESTPSMAGEYPKTEQKPPPLPVTPEEHATALMREVAKQEGFTVEKTEGKEVQQSIDEAAAMVKADSRAGEKLVAQMKADGRGFKNDTEAMLVLHEKVRLQNKQREAMDRVSNPATETDKTEALVDLDRVSKQLQDVHEVTLKAGTTVGRTLRMFQVFMKNDFSLDNVIRMAKASNVKAKLSELELNKKVEEITKLHKEMSEAEKQATKAEDIKALEQHNTDLQRIIDEMLGIKAESQTWSSKAISTLDKWEQESRAALAKMGGRATAGPDVERVYHLSRIGASWVAKGLIKQAPFIKRLINEFGEKIKPYANEIFERAKALVGLAKTTAEKDLEKVLETELRKPTAKAKRPDMETAKKAVLTNGPKDRKALNDLAHAYVQAGFKTPKALIDAMHADLVKSFPELTKRQLSEELIGYGKPTFPNPEKAELRDVKGQLASILKIEDVKKGIRPPKMGPQRDKPSQAKREVDRELNKVLKEANFKDEVTEAKTRTALDAAKTHVRNQIEDLDKAIANTEKLVTNKGPTRTDPELEALRARRDELRAKYEEIFPASKSGMTDQERLDMAIETTQKSIAENERKIREGDLAKKQGQSSPWSAELGELKQKNELYKKSIAEFRKAQEGIDAQQNRDLAAYKQRLTQRYAELMKKQEHLDKGVLPAKRTPREVALDDVALEAKRKVEAKKQEINKRIVEIQMANRSLGGKIWGGVGETQATLRAIMTSMDLSAIGRQGFFFLISHPIATGKAFVETLPAMTERGAFRELERLRERPNFQEAQSNGLALHDEKTTLRKEEEAFVGRWLQKLGEHDKRLIYPILAKAVKGSERVYTSFLNRLRMDRYDAMKATLTSDGKFTPQDAKAVTNFINVATGVGELGFAAPAGNALSKIFFAPRYVTSRFQLTLGQPVWGKAAREASWKVKKAIAADYAKFFAGITVMYELLNNSGLDIKIGKDPTSSDFGKIIVGNTRLDVMGGLLQGTVLLSRIGGHLGESMGISKEKKRVSPSNIGMRFLRTKLSPFAGAIWDLIERQTLTGQSVWDMKEKNRPLRTAKAIGTSAQRMMAPITFQDIYQAMQDHGIAKGAALGILSIFGAGLNTYDERGRQSENR